MKFSNGNFGRGCAKGMLMALNGLCVLLALTVFVFAVVDTRILKQYGDEKAAGSFIGDMIIISVSIVLAAVAIFGCLGAARENVKMLYLYVITLLVLILLELLITVFVTMQRYDLEFRVTEWIHEEFYNNASNIQHQKIWDSIQITYECCGLSGAQDYQALDRPISLSCCPSAFNIRNSYAQTQMYKHCIQYATYYDRGCEQELMYQLQVEDNVFIWIAIVTFMFEAQGILLSMWMANNLKHNMRAHKTTVKY